MTSFRISKGLEINLPVTKTDGRLYFCIDTGNLYIDYQEGENIVRKLVDKSKFDEIETSLGDFNSKFTELSSGVAYINTEDNENIEDPSIGITDIVIDSSLSETSINPVQNKVIT